MIASLDNGIQIGLPFEKKEEKFTLTSDDDNAFHAKGILLEHVSSDRSIAKSDETRDSICASKLQNETNFFENAIGEDQWDFELSFKTTKSLPNPRTVRRFEIETIAMESTNLTIKDNSSGIDGSFYDSCYERAEKFLDLHAFTMVLPAEEQRPRKFVRVLTKHASLEGDQLDIGIGTSPVLSEVKTSSLLLRRVTLSEGKAKKRPPLLTGLPKSTSLPEDSSVFKAFDSNRGKIKEVNEEEEDNKPYKDSLTTIPSQQNIDSCNCIPSYESINNSRKFQLSIVADSLREVDGVFVSKNC